MDAHCNILVTISQYCCFSYKENTESSNYTYHLLPQEIGISMAIPQIIKIYTLEDINFIYTSTFQLKTIIQHYLYYKILLFELDVSTYL